MAPKATRDSSSSMAAAPVGISIPALGAAGAQAPVTPDWVFEEARAKGKGKGKGDEGEEGPDKGKGKGGDDEGKGKGKGEE